MGRYFKNEKKTMLEEGLKEPKFEEMGNFLK